MGTARWPRFETTTRSRTITTILYEHDVQTLLETGEELGYVEASELEALVEIHELSEDDLHELTHALDERGIELRREDNAEDELKLDYAFELPASAARFSCSCPRWAATSC